jgi:diguanylate cyclase (GGDEF)-like protein
MVDLARNLRPGMLVVLAIFMSAGLAGIRYYGVLPLVPPASAFLLYGALWKLNIGRHRHPEYVWAGTLLFAAVMMAVALLLGRGPRGYSLELMSMPVLVAALIFPRRVAVAATLIGVVLLASVLLLVDMPEVRHIPAVAVSSLFVLVSLAVTALVIRDLDDDSRKTVLVDALTGTLNRAALAPKVAELTHRARISKEPVAVIVADIDHFKGINDAHGHLTGDAVLRELASRLRDCVRATEPVYRLGGEEFVVLLPGLDARDAREAAVRMWRAVREQTVDGVAASVSFGVAASHANEPFDFDAVFAQADRALYAAKRAGRDRVTSATELSQPVAAPQPSAARLASTNGHYASTNGHYVSEEALANGRRGIHVGVVAPPRAERRSTGWTLSGSEQATGVGSVTDALEREFTLELNGRLSTLFRVIAVGAFVGASTAIPQFGWHPLIAPAIGAVPYYLLSRHAHRFRRPNDALFGGWAIFQTSIAIGFACSHGAPLFALSVLVQMVPGRCAVLRSTRAAALVTLYTALLMTGVAFWLDAARVLHNPSELLFPLALLVEAGYAGAIVGRSAVASRGAGIVDELTGLLNRNALDTRVFELETQATGTSRQIAIVLGDLDHFKEINDAFGHSCGDAVLRATAERINGTLRSSDSAYRVGGEEFLVLLADADVDTAQQVAARLRRAVRSQSCGERDVTISVGVAATTPGERFIYSEVFARADRALYEAKSAGRDRICIEGAPAPLAVAGAVA